MDNINTANIPVRINANGTTTISGKVLLIRVVINKKGASSNVATLTRSAESGTEGDYVLGVIDTTDRTGSYDYGIPCNNGFTVTVATGTAPDLTVVYRPQP